MFAEVDFDLVNGAHIGLLSDEISLLLEEGQEIRTFLLKAGNGSRCRLLKGGLDVTLYSIHLRKRKYQDLSGEDARLGENSKCGVSDGSSVRSS